MNIEFKTYNILRKGLGKEDIFWFSNVVDLRIIGGLHPIKINQNQ